MIKKGYRANFKTLIEAVKNDDVCIMECTDKESKKKVVVLCAVQPGEGDMIETIPFAKLFDGNPYDELDPPFKE